MQCFVCHKTILEYKSKKRMYCNSRCRGIVTSRKKREKTRLNELENLKNFYFLEKLRLNSSKKAYEIIKEKTK